MKNKEIITEEEFREKFPPELRRVITPEILKELTKIDPDPIFRQSFKENLFTCKDALLNGRYKMITYINAIKYVSYKLMNLTNIEAFSKVFPDRIKSFHQRKFPRDKIHGYVSCYTRTKLVTTLLEQTLTPIHILNAPILQKAINVLAELMVTAKSEKVRCDAANNLLTQLRPPEIKKMELEIGPNVSRALDVLKASSQELAQKQREMLQQGSIDLETIAEKDLKRA